MPFSDFIGNEAAVAQLRRLLAEGCAQRTIVLAGPEGVGKSTLALMLGWALNCPTPPQPGDFCGVCERCATLTPLGEVDQLVALALAHREAEVKTAPRETAPLRVAPHSAVRYFPPDGDMLSMPQARAAIQQAHFHPDAGATWTLVLPELDRARWTTQAALLKTLEEPPPGVTLVATVRNLLALLPTVRSRALVIRLAPVPAPDLIPALERLGRGEASRLLARLSQGCPGRALRLDVAVFRQARAEAFELLAAGLNSGFSSVFRLCESTRTSKEKFESLLEILYSILQDINYLQSGFSEAVRNLDSVRELTPLTQRLSPDRLPEVVSELDRLHAAAGRNVFRPLGLGAWALGLARA